MQKRPVHIGLGSNQGDREGSLRRAVQGLSLSGLRPARLSSLYRSDPVEVTDQEEFINQVIRVETDLALERILTACLTVETSMGRIRTRDKGPRGIDLDLLLAGGEVHDGPGLVVPHPRMHLRRFVLVPLVEVDPTARHPLLDRTAAELLEICPDRSRVERLDRQGQSFLL